MKLVLSLLFLALGACASAPQATDETPTLTALPEVSRSRLAAFDAVLLLRDSRDGGGYQLQPEAFDRQTSPCSTFKVPHALIALEEGVLAAGVDTVLPWSGLKMPIKSWELDHNLQSAMTHSVVWYFQEIARRLGLAKEQAWLTALDYGNADPSSDLTRFWLGGGSLKISPREQVEFWQRLVAGRLPAAAENMAAVLDLVELERRPDGSRLLGKTGSAVLGSDLDDMGLGWFTGAVERAGQVQVFALRIEGPGAWGPAAKAIMIAILADLDLWPGSA